MYLIVVGAGDIGTPLVDVAMRAGNEVVVIERDEERANRAADDFDCLVLNDDATIKETLEDAGATQADAITPCRSHSRRAGAVRRRSTGSYTPRSTRRR